MTHEMIVDKTFLKDLEIKLKELRSRCDLDTIDVVIFGGRTSESSDRDKSGQDSAREKVLDDKLKEEYGQDLASISKISRESIGKELRVIVDPKTSIDPVDNVLFDTISRRLYVERYVIPEE